MVKEELIKDFENELQIQIGEIIKEVYKPTLFLRIAAEVGLYQAAVRIVEQEKNPSGFIKLLEAQRTELSIEAIVVKDKYRSIFSEKAIKNCEARLRI